MKCTRPNCNNPSVISIKYSKDSPCKNHFIRTFEKRVNYAIKTYKMLKYGDKVGVAVSGGKDSLNVLYLTMKYCQSHQIEKPIAIAIDEGIKGYRSKTIKALKKFCKKYEIELVIKSYKEEHGKTLDALMKQVKTEKIPTHSCSVCGVLRRYDLNKAATELGLTKLVTGHNLDDEVQTLMINIMRGDTERISRLGPVTGIGPHSGFVQRIKPLYLIPEKESMLYAVLKGFDVDDEECPYSQDAFRLNIRDLINEMEFKHPSTKFITLNSGLKLIEMAKEHYKKDTPGKVPRCKECGELSAGDTCRTCQIMELFK
ncbi:MAG: TIGR00269 family protein [Candidatus Diapherotrites archaeon]|nr:TIGR00269 family protein [Candidatus Diapherotrites archaeon]